MNDEYVENITMPDGSIWLQLGEIRRRRVYRKDIHANVDVGLRDNRTFIKLDEIVGVEHSSCDGSVSASVVLRGGVTVDVKTTVSETMEIIQEAIDQNHHGLVSMCSNCRKAYQKNPKQKGTK